MPTARKRSTDLDVQTDGSLDLATVLDMLKNLGREELATLLAEKGEVLIQDEVCNHEYRYGAEILEQLFPTPKRTLH